jgi:hypothetical protein
MKPTWLIERGVFKDEGRAFKAEVERQGMTCAEVDYRPGKKPPGDIFGCPQVADGACVVLWGTLPLMQQIQIHHSWVPGGWCNIGNLDCSTYYAYFGPFLLNSFYSILPGVEAIRLEDRLFEEFGVNDEIFVRPSRVHKLFTGTVAYKDNFRDAMAASRYDPTTLVVVSSPKEIGREWRFVIGLDEIVAASQYRDNGAIGISRGCPDDVSQYVADILSRVSWRPDKLFVMDVCESDDRLHVLELNSFSCSGFYDCDVAAIVRAASDAAENEWAHREVTL